MRKNIRFKTMVATAIVAVLTSGKKGQPKTEKKGQ